jgi:membrane-associated protease RseP (regulator of RpoE activity)
MAVVWVVAVLAAYIWSRPSGSEQAVLSRYPRRARVLFFIPFSQGWQQMLNSRDCSALSGLRRRSLLSVLGVALLALAGIALARYGPVGGVNPAKQPAQAVQKEAAPIPQKREAFVPPEPGEEKAGQMQVRRPAPAGKPPASEEVPKPPENQGATHTVTLDDDRALSEPRRQVRLFGGANVKPLYDSSYRKIIGIQVNNVRPGSFWQTLGIRSGDVIVELNGERIDNTEAGNKLITSLGQERVLHLRVQGADGKERYLDYITPE